MVGEEGCRCTRESCMYSCGVVIGHHVGQKEWCGSANWGLCTHSVISLLCTVVLVVFIIWNTHVLSSVCLNCTHFLMSSSHAPPPWHLPCSLSFQTSKSLTCTSPMAPKTFYLALLVFLWVPQEQALYHLSLDFLYHWLSAVRIAMTQAHIY